MSQLSLNTGLKSILTARYMLATIGHNIANANTPGYTRQRVEIGNDPPISLGGLLLGSGVSASNVQRSVDSLLNRRILTQVTVSGRLESQLVGMTEIEGLLGELDGQGVGGLMDSFFTSISELSTNPDDAILASGVAQAAVTLSAQFNGISNNLSDLKRDTTAELGVRVEEVNLLADQVLALNLEITKIEASGSTANDLRDQRDVALEELSRRVDTRVIEEANGAVRVLVAGNTLVSSARVYELSVTQTPGGDPAIEIEGSDGFVPVSGGTIGGLLRMAGSFVGELSSEFDQLAHNLILELNRLHSTGVPASGGFSNLTGSSAILDLDKDGDLRDELLSNAGLPFDVSSGVLLVNVNDETTGDVDQHQIQISETHTTVGELLDALNDVPNLSADLDSFGRVRLLADGGFTFDFSAKLDQNPDAIGSFGGGRASLGTGEEPFALADGDTLDLTVPAGGTSLSIAFNTADFADVNAATAAELAAVINNDPGAQAVGIVAADVNGRLILQTLAEGSTADFTVDGGTVLGALGWAGFAGSTVTGHDNAVEAKIAGAYTGDGDDVFTFVPNMDGTIGTTPGLIVDVFDATGNKIASLDVGEGYTPGEELAVAEGITVSFGLGDLSATHNDVFALDVVEDADTSDVLVALGINSLFVGTDASDIALREDIELDPTLISTSVTGSSGDNTLLLDVLGLQNQGVEGLEGATFGRFYGDTIGNFGFELSSTVDAIGANDSLQASLGLLREQVSGVNVDEELVDLVKYEQAFQAASQFITVVNELNDELLNLL